LGLKLGMVVPFTLKSLKEAFDDFGTLKVMR